ncbi:MAG TPA: hypothetical protein EYF95_08130 [Flavobacteriales bacterium]|nr:hypothetical protein [Flavobacteriales bacterium]HIK67924.1 hypothetical protein [Flavobacteriales bacterium]
MIGIFELSLYRDDKLIKEVYRKNTIDVSNTGIKKLIIAHLVSSSGNAGIFLDQNWSSPNGSPTTNNQEGIFFDSSPIQVSQYTGTNDTVIGYGALCSSSKAESQPSSNQARWTARRTWTESTMTGTNYVTDFSIGMNYQADMLNDGTGSFSIPFATTTLSASDKFQPATNDIIDITWTITVG